MSQPPALLQSSISLHVPAPNCISSFFCCLKINTQPISSQYDALSSPATSHLLPAFYTHIPLFPLIPMCPTNPSAGPAVTELLCILQARGCFLRSIEVWGAKEDMGGVSASTSAPGLRASHGMRRWRPMSPCVPCSCLQGILIVHSQ